MSVDKFSEKFLILRGPAAGNVVHQMNLVPVSKIVYKNVKILNGKFAGQYTQVTDLLIPNEVKTPNGAHPFRSN